MQHLPAGTLSSREERAVLFPCSCMRVLIVPFKTQDNLWEEGHWLYTNWLSDGEGFRRGYRDTAEAWHLWTLTSEL